MNFGIIKNNVCINIAVFDNKEKAEAFKEVVKCDNSLDDIVEIQENFGIGDTYKNGSWTKKKIDLDKIKQEKILLSKNELKKYLKNNPLKYTDEKYYTVTKEKQNLLANKLYMFSSGIDTSPLMWNASGEENTEWTFKDLSDLALKIFSYVNPLVLKQQKIENSIKACKTEKELNEIVIEY